MKAIQNLSHQQGYIHSNTLRGNRAAFLLLQELIKKGEVEKLRTGLYKITAIANKNYYQEISLIYPKATICLNSAAAYYNLTDQIPAEMHLAIGQKTKMKIVDYPPVKLHYWSDKMINQHQVIVNDVKIFSLERTVCDIIRTYRKTDVELVKEVTHNYLKLPTRDFDLLLSTAMDIGIKEKVKSIFELIV